MPDWLGGQVTGWEQSRGGPVCRHFSEGERIPMAGPGAGSEPRPGGVAETLAGRTGGASPAAVGPQLRVSSRVLPQPTNQVTHRLIFSAGSVRCQLQATLMT